ncbi:hypothetical protein SAMN02745673_01585 [Marinactinospora thermotolerans DSM 45154]|uniref:Uncharacterized protein n=1 Tax=Marinactinospora thermotolerans DSM 45154 TaxID=1122192 RepID=A0A1T4NT62_9ACTN|nr:hypothetical protein SAMN02745673_01585 [Marinactinospora thermotolerans DSM 45154]
MSACTPAGPETSREHYAAQCQMAARAWRLGVHLSWEEHRHGWEYCLMWPDGRCEVYGLLSRVQERLDRLEREVRW